MNHRWPKYNTCICTGLVTKLYKECLQLNNKKKTQLKMAEDLDTSQEMWNRQINLQEKCLIPCQPIFKVCT